MNHADCAHCTHSRAEWTGAGVGVALLCVMGFRVRKAPHDCGSYQREPGSDQEALDINALLRRNPDA